MNTPAAPLSPAKNSWHVLGAGAIGGLWALRLASLGHPVTLISGSDYSPHRTLCLQDGATLFSHEFPQQPAETAHGIERMLVTTKANLTAAALAPLLPALKARTPVLLLQNGMGVEDAVLAQRPDLCLLCGITTDGVYRPERDTLVMAGHGETLIGSLRADDEKAAEEIAGALTGQRWSARYASDIRLRRWQKLAMNCAINPLTARYRCRNGELLENPAALAEMRQVCAELAAVMQAEGLAIDAGELFTLVCAAAAKTAANISSMRADVEAGRATEILFLNGYLLQRAASHGIDVPANTALVAEILALHPR